MSYITVTFTFAVAFIYCANCEKCNVDCPMDDTKMVCGFNVEGIQYKMFPSKCAMAAYSQCYKAGFVQTPLQYCMKRNKVSRRTYGESCPAFCPNHYRPVCGASKLRSYMYRSFTNGCYLDMLNCRSEDEMFGYVEVPLDFCQRHAMKNIFKEQIIMTNLNDNRDYS